MKIPSDISQIAALIQKDWKHVSQGAAPYLKAMQKLNSVYDRYNNESARTIIRKFLNNEQYWHGETTREIKKKLQELSN